MRVDLPFSVEYGTPDAVPINEVIDSLVSIRGLIEEGGASLPHFVDGLEIEQVQVFVRSISQESPLRELLAVTLFVTFQKNLEKEVPEMIQNLTGLHVPEQFHTIVTLAVVVALFYGAGYVKDVIAATHVNSKVKRQLSLLVSELSSLTGKEEQEIRKFLDDRYKVKGRLETLAGLAVAFFRPSKSQRNAPVMVDGRKIESDIVEDVPAEYAYEEALATEVSREFRGVELELHAQDRDRDQTGWAAVPKGITDKRLRMRLVDGVSTDQLWGKNHVRGDIVVKYKRTGVDSVPTEIHLSRIVR